MTGRPLSGHMPVIDHADGRELPDWTRWLSLDPPPKYSRLSENDSERLYGEGVWGSRRSVRLSTGFSGWPVGAGWSGRCWGWWSAVALKSPCQLSHDGQSLGRCRTSRLAEVARRAGPAVSCRRMVAVVALAWKTEAMVPAVRVRLNAIAASTSQALFAANEPEVS